MAMSEHGFGIEIDGRFLESFHVLDRDDTLYHKMLGTHAL